MNQPTIANPAKPNKRPSIRLLPRILAWRNTRASLVLAAALTAILSQAASTNEIAPEDFPEFIVPGQESSLKSLRQLFWLHYKAAGPLIALWDAWLPMCTLWPAVGAGEHIDRMPWRWANGLRGRMMNAEGYITTQQHDGPAHAEGWPFPSWMKAGGIGWHFRGTGIAGYDPPTTTPKDWKWVHAIPHGVDEKGWVVELTEPNAFVQTPAFEINTSSAPWLRLNWWAEGLERANCYVEWTTKEKPEFSSNRRFYFSPASAQGETLGALPPGGVGGRVLWSQVETRTMIPVYREPEWRGTITGLRLGFDNKGPARVIIKSFHTACDTRHSVNNLNFIRGAHDYFAWTGDLTFLREQMNRVRLALHFTMREFDTLRRKCIYTTWPGHEGRSGIQRNAAGQKTIVPGAGIGGNYWDLLPFGGEDALATIYYYDTLLKLAELEEWVKDHPEWGIPEGGQSFAPQALRSHAREVREYGSKRFWNLITGRFGTVDLDGFLHDYGWTFLNNEAVCYAFADQSQARSIRDWISGKRLVSGDTSTGEDIYRWRFGPRSSTRRNIDYYYWGWAKPEEIAWGYQVQDGGAVLGFSYHDLLCRLVLDGPDDCWRRLRELLNWFEETQAEGGYRAFYLKDPARGSMQGGNVAGGLGIDQEFFESVLVPQIVIYGFLGFEPTPFGFRIHPKLPSTWPELKITHIHLHDLVISLTAKANGDLIVDVEKPSLNPLTLELPEGRWHTTVPGAELRGAHITLRLPSGTTQFTHD